MIKMPAPALTMGVLGIVPDGTVQVPWRIGPYKQEFRPFAETLAAALPDGTAYETKKMWRVHCFGRIPRISDLLHDPKALRIAFEILSESLKNFQKQNS